MDLVQVPSKAHGNFYEGDCYVLLSVSVLKVGSGKMLEIAAYDLSKTILNLERWFKTSWEKGARKDTFVGISGASNIIHPHPSLFHTNRDQKRYSTSQLTLKCAKNDHEM